MVGNLRFLDYLCVDFYLALDVRVVFLHGWNDSRFEYGFRVALGDMLLEAGFGGLSEATLASNRGLDLV